MTTSFYISKKCKYNKTFVFNKFNRDEFLGTRRKFPKTSRRDRFNSIEFKYIWIQTNCVLTNHLSSIPVHHTFKSFNHTKFLTLLFIPFNFLQKNVFYQYKYSRLGQFAIPFLNELLSCTSIWLYEKIRDAKSFLLCSILYVSLKTYMF